MMIKWYAVHTFNRAELIHDDLVHPHFQTALRKKYSNCMNLSWDRYIGNDLLKGVVIMESRLGT